MHRYVWIALFLLCPLAVATSVNERIKVRPPLVEDENRRKYQKQAHCNFGNQTYEVEERWKPDLGPPFGMLFCMRCECVAVQRKKRIMSRVRCKNIGNDCPIVTCPDAYTPPDRCCKVCPGEDFADLEEDIATRKLDSEDEEKVLKEFTVLLTGKLMNPSVAVSGAARGYLVFTKKDLHFTIHYQGIPRPLFIRFVTEEDNIVEEHEISEAPHHTQGFKLCGVWHKVPKPYRRLLQKEKMSFVLVTKSHPDGIVGGRILKHSSINTESYGSLLLPDVKHSTALRGSGGMADIFPVSDSIHVSLGFNGIFSAKDVRDVPLVVSLYLEELDGRMMPISEVTVALPKAHPEHNSATVKLDLSPQFQERLSSGKLELRIASKDGLRRHVGRIIPKVTCNVFQAVMTTTDTETSEEYREEPVTGFMILDIDTDGFINYKLHISDENIKSVTVQLETDVETPTGTGMRVLQRVLQNLTDSWGNGSFIRRSSQEVEMMLSDDLVVSVYTDEPLLPPNVHGHREDGSILSRTRVSRSEKKKMELRGPVRQRLYTDALLSEMPILLSGGNNTSSRAGGVAWLSVDKHCILYFQVVVAGLDPKQKHVLEMQQSKGKFMQPLNRVLKRFEGEQTEGMVDNLETRNLYMLQSGDTYLILTSKGSDKEKTVKLRTQVQELSTPPSCLTTTDVSSLRRQGNTFQDGSNDVYVGPEWAYKCVDHDDVYDDGDYWKAANEDCTMCSCQRGRVICERAVCPQPACENPVTVPGECCPLCLDNSTSEVGGHRTQRLCFFDQGDKKYHLAGSKWHPFVPPFGFSVCSVCTCEPKSLTVKCERVTCPTLTCSEKESFRDSPESCCKKCPPSETFMKSEVIIPPSAIGSLGDQGKAIVKEILGTGGCKWRGHLHPNGDEWSPTLDPYGVEKCVKCHCKDGKAKCKRKRCPLVTCPVKVPSDDGCCDRCLDTLAVHDSPARSDVPGKGKKRRKDRERRHRKVRQPKQKSERKEV